MPDTDDRPVTKSDMENVTAAGLPELVRRRLANGCAPERKDEAPDATSDTTT
jgi:hypothetical protein